MVADELAEREDNPAAGLSTAVLTQIAERLETVATALEEVPQDR
jgi:hypothetical protein